MRKALALALVGLYAGIGIANSAGAAPAYTLHYKLPVGRHLRYDLHLNLAAQGMKISAVFTMTATKHAAGRYTIITTIDSLDAPGAHGDQIKQMLAGTKITQITDDSGRTISTKAEGQMKAMFQGGGMGAGAIYPVKPVHIGDTWSGSSTVGGKTVNVKVKLVAVKSHIATLNLTPEGGPSNEQPQPVVTRVDMNTGIMQTMEISSGSGPSAMQMTIKLR